MALEILLSDFSMGHVYGDWLRERMREVEGKDDCKLKNSHLLESHGLIGGIVIHLSTFVDCQFLAKLKLSQVSLMKALSECESDILEVLFQPAFVTLTRHT